MNSDLAQHFVGLGLHRISADYKKGLHFLLRYEQSLGTEIHHFIEILTGTKLIFSILIVLIICMGESLY